MTNCADPDQLASSTDLDLHCLLRQGMSCSAREGLRDNLHKKSNPISWENKSIINLSSAKLAQRVVIKGKYFRKNVSILPQSVTKWSGSTLFV